MFNWETKKKKIYGVLIQNAEILLRLKGKEILSSLFKLKKLGFFKKIGISIYDFKTLETILNKKLKIDFVQLPYNVFDQRFSNKRLINKLKKRKVEIHARSIFLQGLLVAQNIHLPKRLNKLGKAILKWNLWLSEKNINPVHTTSYHDE